MRKLKNLYLPLTAAVALSVASLQAQNVAAHAASSFATPIISTASSSATSGPPDSSTETIIKNRARVFAGRISPRGIEYWSFVDSDLKRVQSPDQLLKDLSPSTIQASDHVRALDMVVDIKEPLTIFTKPGESLSVGSATIDGEGVRSLSVTSILSMNRLAIISK